MNENNQTIHIKSYVLSDLRTNCYLVWEGKTRNAIVIDPAIPDPAIEDKIKSEKLTLNAIINTHGHLDHIGGNRAFKEKYNAPLYIHPADRSKLTNSFLNFSFIFGKKIDSPDADGELTENQNLKLGDIIIKIFETPGHSPGSISLLIGNNLFSGDTLFCNSIGRTDIPGGSIKQLTMSIINKLFLLPDDIQVYPGHGPKTTIGFEKRNNPFVHA